MTGYSVAIPSRQRSGLLTQCTLPVLLDGGVPRAAVAVWVLHEEVATYRGTLDAAGYEDIAVHGHGSRSGLRGARNVLQNQYPVGTRLVQADDDIRAIERLDAGRLAPVTNVDAMIQQAFIRAGQQGVSLWGVYPVRNGFFMANRAHLGFRHIVGTFWGMTLRHDPAEMLNFDEKEDYERTIRHFLRDGAVLRLDNVTLKTRFYTEPGGMQVYRDAAYQDEGTRRLVVEWPDLLTYRRSDAKGTAEVRMKRLPGVDLPAIPVN